MELNGTVTKVLLRDFQVHPWKQQVLHIDFQRVDETTRLRKKVPLHFSGEENSVAVKTDKCLVSHVANELEIECLATQLPEFIAVDLSGLVKGKSLHASDLKLPEGIKAVDYDAATKHAERAYGGGLMPMSSEGGAVHPSMAGLGFADAATPMSKQCGKCTRGARQGCRARAPAGRRGSLSNRRRHSDQMCSSRGLRRRRRDCRKLSALSKELQARLKTPKSSVRPQKAHMTG